MRLDLLNVAVDTPAGKRLFAIPEASIDCGLTALTGHNGAGKSTLLRTIFGLHPLASGTIKLDGLDSRRDRRKFLSMSVFQPQNFAAYPDLSGVEFLVYFLRLRGASSADARAHAGEWIERVGLSEAAHERTSDYSHGMLQRLGLAYALQTDATLCVLDEPFAGVDPAARGILSDLLSEAGRQRIILICTHHVEDMVERGARIVEISNGRWIQGSVA